MATTKAKPAVKATTSKTKTVTKTAPATKSTVKAVKPTATVKTKSTVTAKAAAPKNKVVAFSEAEVAKKAYEIYLTRNGFSGDQFSDWFQAETELKNRQN